MGLSECAKLLKCLEEEPNAGKELYQTELRRNRPVKMKEKGIKRCELYVNKLHIRPSPIPDYHLNCRIFPVTFLFAPCVGMWDDLPAKSSGRTVLGNSQDQS